MTEKLRDFIDGHDVRMARAGLRLTVRELADAAHVSPNTVTRIEAGYPANVSTLQALKRIFNEHGVQFLADGSVLLSKEAVAARNTRDSPPDEG